MKKAVQQQVEVGEAGYRGVGMFALAVAAPPQKARITLPAGVKSVSFGQAQRYRVREGNVRHRSPFGEPAGVRERRQGDFVRCRAGTSCRQERFGARGRAGGAGVACGGLQRLYADQRAASVKRSWEAPSRALTRRRCGRASTRFASPSMDRPRRFRSRSNELRLRVSSRSRRHDSRRQQSRARELAPGVRHSRRSA